MRKIVLTTLMAAVAFAASPVSKSLAATIPPKPPTNQPAATKSHTNVGPWVVGCLSGSVASLMVGSAVKANDKKEPRQLTINEAGWHAAVCPLFLPWALLVQATCPDNKATKQVARLAFLYLQKRKAGDQSKFTAAYGEACRTGKLSPQTVASLKALI